MDKPIDMGEGVAYDIADEVDGIRRTLDQFMRKQEENNQNFHTGIEQILSLPSNNANQYDFT